MLATHFTLSLDEVPTPDDFCMKSREYLLIKTRARNRYSNYGNYSGTNTGANSSWYKPRDDMDKRRSYAKCGSMDHHVSAYSASKQNMKAIEASYVIWRDTSSRTALNFGMQWRTRNIPAMKKRFRASKPVEPV